MKTVSDLEKKKNLKPDIKEVIKDFNKDTKIIMPNDHDTKHMKKIASADPLFAKKEQEKDVKDKKIISPEKKPDSKEDAKKMPGP